MGFLHKFPLPDSVLALVPADYAWDPRAKPEDVVQVADVQPEAIAWNERTHPASQDLFNAKVRETLTAFDKGEADPVEVERALRKWYS